jgi:hypothetical protein
MNEKSNNIELTSTKDDIQVDSINENFYSSENRVRNRQVEEENSEEFENLTLSELTRRVHQCEHEEIRDWPKRPYKTIIIVFLLLFSGLLFTFFGYYKYSTNHTYDVYLPYSFLGGLLLFPGIYYTFILINIWLDREGYDYSELPEMHE